MNEWISVEERFPEKDGRYLVCEDCKPIWVGVCSMRNGQFELEVTHWMNLPEPPK